MVTFPWLKITVPDVESIDHSSLYDRIGSDQSLMASLTWSGVVNQVPQRSNARPQNLQKWQTDESTKLEFYLTVY